MDMLYLDFYGKVAPPSRGYNYILSVRDSFTRYCWLLPTKDMSASSVINSLNSNVFAYFGIPSFLKSDNHTCFSNNLLKEICQRLQITADTIPPYNYWSNLPERFHQDLGRYLRSMLDNRNKEDWAELLPAICLAANSSIHQTTQLSPFFLMFGRPPNIPLDLIHNKTILDPPDGIKTFPQKAAGHAAKIVRMHAEALEAVRKAWKKDIDHRSRAYSAIAPDEFKIGAKVLVFTPSRKKFVSDKLVSAWKGPFLISKKLSDIMYKVKEDPENIKAGRPPKGVIGLSRLKIVIGDEDTPTPTPDEEDEVYFPHEYEALYNMEKDKETDEEIDENCSHEN